MDQFASGKEGGDPPGSIRDHHLSLMRAYLNISRFVDSAPPVSWLPLFRLPGVLGVPIIPVSRFLVRLFACAHIKRVVEAADRSYRMHAVLDDEGTRDADWTKLHEQSESMKAILRTPTFSSWMTTIGVIGVVLLIGQTQAQKPALLTKLFVAAAMLNPDKLVEIAYEPQADTAFVQFAFWLLMALIAMVPILVYHFRYKRALFNHPGITSQNSAVRMTIADVWRQRSVERGSVYGLERRVFAAIDERAPREIPIDLIAIGIAFGYHAAGPGLLVGVIAYMFHRTEVQTGNLLYFVAAVNIMISLPFAIRALMDARQRAELARRI